MRAGRAGRRSGDRVALYLQNVPQFAIGVIAAWKLGAIVVPVNPMLKERERRAWHPDSGATAVISLEQLHEDVASRVLAGTGVRTAITTSPLDYLDEPPALLRDRTGADADAEDFARSILRRTRASSPTPRASTGDDVARLVYTSGTTGPPKGAMNLHRNVTFASTVWRDWPRRPRTTSTWSSHRCSTSPG